MTDEYDAPLIQRVSDEWLAERVADLELDILAATDARDAIVSEQNRRERERA